MEMLKKKFENYSIRELEELIDNNSVSSIELAAVRKLLKEKKSSDISIEDIDNKITLIIELGSSQQKKDLCNWIGDSENYSQLSREIKEKVMKMDISSKEKTSTPPKVKERDQNSPNIKDVIADMLKKGLSVKEVSKQLQCKYSKVYWINKKLQ